MAELRQHLRDSQRGGLKTETYWAKRLMRIIALEEKEMPFIGLGDTVQIPKRQGNTKYTLKRYLKLPVDIAKALLVEGIPPKFMKMEGTKVSGEVFQYGAIIGFTDVQDAVHFDNLKEIYQPELARHANELRERIVLETLDAEASEWTVGGILTLQELRKAALTMRVNLRRGHKAGGGKTVTVVPPQVMQDLVDDPKLLSHMLLTGQENAPIKNATLRGYVVYDLAIQESMLLADYADYTGNNFVSYMMGEDPYKVITMGDLTWHEVGFTATHGDPLAQNSSIGYKFWIGAKVVDPVAIIKITSKGVDYKDIEAGENIVVAGNAFEDPFYKDADQDQIAEFKNIQKAIDGIVYVQTAASGATVPTNELWTTAAVKTTMTNAVDVAQGIVDAGTANQQTADAALDTLNAAILVYNNAKAPGTKA